MMTAPLLTDIQERSHRAGSRASEGGEGDGNPRVAGDQPGLAASHVLVEGGQAGLATANARVCGAPAVSSSSSTSSNNNISRKETSAPASIVFSASSLLF